MGRAKGFCRNPAWVWNFGGDYDKYGLSGQGFVQIMIEAVIAHGAAMSAGRTAQTAVPLKWSIAPPLSGMGSQSRAGGWGVEIPATPPSPQPSPSKGRGGGRDNERIFLCQRTCLKSEILDFIPETRNPGRSISPSSEGGLQSIQKFYATPAGPPRF
jgi:hypothetical protein